MASSAVLKPYCGVLGPIAPLLSRFAPPGAGLGGRGAAPEAPEGVKMSWAKRGGGKSGRVSQPVSQALSAPTYDILSKVVFCASTCSSRCSNLANIFLDSPSTFMFLLNTLSNSDFIFRAINSSP